MRYYEIISEMVVRDRDPSGQFVIAYKGDIWILGDQPNNKVFADIESKTGVVSNENTFYDFADEVMEQRRYDILCGTIDDDMLNLYDSISLINPRSSMLIKKTVQALGLKGVIQPCAYQVRAGSHYPYARHPELNLDCSGVL